MAEKGHAAPQESRGSLEPVFDQGGAPLNGPAR